MAVKLSFFTKDGYIKKKYAVCKYSFEMLLIFQALDNIRSTNIMALNIFYDFVSAEFDLQLSLI